jgi:VanZ family protein
MIKLLKKNILSIITALVILYLSLANANTFSKVKVFIFPEIDKVVHMCMYFGLMIVLLYENRLSLRNNRSIFLLSVIPFIYGILMECLQSWLTTTRTADLIDALFDLIGIFLAMIAWKLFRRSSTDQFK